jgi:hypothetical protein
VGKNAQDYFVSSGSGFVSIGIVFTGKKRSKLLSIKKQ